MVAAVGVTLCSILALMVQGERAEAQSRVSIYDLYVFDWLGAVKVVWKAAGPEEDEAVFQIYRSEVQNGPFTLIQEIRRGDRDFLDPLTGNYVFYDRKVKRDRSYYYQVRLRGTNMVLGPARALARSGPPGT